MKTFVAAVAVFALMAVPAMAQWSFQYDPGAGTRAAAPQARAKTPGGRQCRPLCVADLSPCDPPEFKAADGRCNDPFLLW